MKKQERNRRYKEKTIPEEYKGEVLGIVKGFALCAENEKEDHDRRMTCSGAKE